MGNGLTKIPSRESSLPNIDSSAEIYEVTSIVARRLINGNGKNLQYAVFGAAFDQLLDFEPSKNFSNTKDSYSTEAHVVQLSIYSSRSPVSTAPENPLTLASDV